MRRAGRLRRMRRRPQPAADAMKLLSSIYPRIDHAAGKVGSGGRHSRAGPPCRAPCARPARGRCRTVMSLVLLRPPSARLESGQTPIRSRAARRKPDVPQRYTWPKNGVMAESSQQCPNRDKTWPDILDTPH
ncbi:hypothetical protein BDI4_760007 [Burkholderia diffusa]|nr:hypothetical protein BDI4_760007 [Burkholderia diffusa]